MITRVFRYVPHSRVAEFQELGWVIVSELGPPHGEYSCLMEKLEDDE